MSIGSLLTNLFAWRQSGAFDERFIMHRFKSTRFAVLVGMVALFALFTYDAVAHKLIRWDLLGVSGAMAIAKACAMLYYRRTN